MMEEESRGSVAQFCSANCNFRIITLRDSFNYLMSSQGACVSAKREEIEAGLNTFEEAFPTVTAYLERSKLSLYLDPKLTLKKLALPYLNNREDFYTYMSKTEPLEQRHWIINLDQDIVSDDLYQDYLLLWKNLAKYLKEEHGLNLNRYTMWRTYNLLDSLQLWDICMGFAIDNYNQYGKNLFNFCSLASFSHHSFMNSVKDDENFPRCLTQIQTYDFFRDPLAGVCFLGQNRMSKFTDSNGSPSNETTSIAYDLNSNYSSAMTHAQPVSSFIVYNHGQRKELLYSVQAGAWRYWNKDGCFEKYNPIKKRPTLRGLGLIVDLHIPKHVQLKFERFPVIFIRQSTKPSLLSPWQNRLREELEFERTGVKKRKKIDQSACAIEDENLPSYIPKADFESRVFYPDRVSDAAFKPKNSSERSSCRVTPVVSSYIVNYNVCWRMLRWLLMQGVVLLNIIFCVEFETHPILREFVTSNNERRKRAKHKSCNLRHKLLNNR